MSQCSVCFAKCDTWLCGKHVRELRDLLNDLPWWLDRLLEESVGQVKKSDGGRSSSRREPFRGDDEVLPKCTCGHAEHEAKDCEAIDIVTVERRIVSLVDGDEEDDTVTDQVQKPCRCTEYRPVRKQSELRRQFLASGGVNARASEQLDAMRNAITTWMRHICEQRRRDWVTFVPAGFIGPLRPGEFRRYTYPIVDDAAYWLAWNITTIASDEAAGECFHAFADGMKMIEKVVNPPLAIRWLGPCPTFDDRTRRRCRTELSCREDETQATCPKCRVTHTANWVQQLAMDELENEKMTVDEILRYNRMLPEEWRVNERTLRRWRKPGRRGEPPKLKIRGYRRPNGREVINRHTEDDEPLFLYSDIKKLRAEGPQRRAKAG